ncbi:cell number regulator 1 [Helianthus annuus]|uniref:cell number regulator 1 n=1 Tax=Helianthus annuus TaxID=4232 RepID=UPI000B8F91F7|nr:cell number regulator 1 [Helianthus annuus]
MGRVEETLPDETTFQYSPSQGYPAQIPPYTNHHEIKQPLPPSQIQQPPAIYQPQHGIPQMYSYAPPPVTTPNWYPPPTVQEWTTGLLECFDDPEIAIMTLCFPCVTFGQIATAKLDGKEIYPSSSNKWLIVQL